MDGALDLLAFAGVMALGQFSPGPDMILLTRSALKEGAGAGVKMALGIACGLAVHATLAVAGLALVFERSRMLGNVLRWVAAAYLLWLAWRIVIHHFVAWYSGGKAAEAAEKSPPARSPFLRGLWCNLLNPKVAIILGAVSAPFLHGNHPRAWPFFLWAIIVGQGALLWSLWAVLLQWPRLRDFYRRAEPWIDAAFGLALVVLAALLILN